MIKKMLAVRSDRFGEFLLNIPAFRALKETYPQAELTLAVSADLCQLAGAVECADKVVIWDQVKGRLRGFGFDLCVVFNPTKEAHCCVFLAGIPVRVGYDCKWGFLLTHKMKDLKYFGRSHEVDYNLELAGLLGAKASDKNPSIRIDESLYKNFIGRKIAAIHPFTSDPVKQWPVERFCELADRIRFELDMNVAMVGVYPGLLELSDSIINMVNRTTLPELAVLLKRASVVISGDSGPMHLAACVGTPVVALFRNDLPGKTARRWGPWGKGHKVIERDRLEKISVDEVFEKVKEIIQA
jgi:ADP-heptose:LPS heptosyltransferase